MGFYFSLYLEFCRLLFILINRLVLNLSHKTIANEDSEFRSRTGMEPPVFASNSILGHIGGPLRTLPDDMENDAFEGDEVIDAEDVADMTDEKVAESSSSNIEFRRSAIIDIDFVLCCAH